MLKNYKLNIVLEDGFQMFLSEKDFLTNNIKNNENIIKILKNNLLEKDKELGYYFPNINFESKDIETLVKVETNLDKKIRMDYSFMTFVLAEKD